MYVAAHLPFACTIFSAPLHLIPVNPSGKNGCSVCIIATAPWRILHGTCLECDLHKFCYDMKMHNFSIFTSISSSLLLLSRGVVLYDDSRQKGPTHQKEKLLS